MGGRARTAEHRWTNGGESVNSNNIYAYVNGNPVSDRDPSGEDPALALVGLGAGAIWGVVNGIIAGDSRAELIADSIAGAAQGGLIGVTDGLSLLENVGFNAVTNAGIESYRQIANSAVTGCDKYDERAVGMAVLGGALGDAFEAASSAIRAETSSVANHTEFLPEEYDSLAKFISLNIGGVAQTPYSAVVHLSQ